MSLYISRFEFFKKHDYGVPGCIYTIGAIHIETCDHSIPNIGLEYERRYHDMIKITEKILTFWFCFWRIDTKFEISFM